MLSMIPFGLCLVSAFIACVTDLRTRLIPNWLTFPLLGAGLLFACATEGLGGLVTSATGMLACFAPSYFLFTRGALGGGDVKLFAGFGALVGARDGLELQLCAFVLVSVFAVLMMAWRGQLWALLRASLAATLHLIRPARFPRPVSEMGSTEVPMGAAIFVAVVALCARGLV